VDDVLGGVLGIAGLALDAHDWLSP
jgi:hypothetical protein